MLFISWNMGCGAPSRYRRSHADAWAYLLDLQPDVAFVQEALRSSAPPTARGRTFWSANGGTDSGAAVFVRQGVRAKRVAVRSAGSYVSGVSVSSAGTPILLASVHVASGDYKEHRRVLTQTLASVTAGKRFVVGGDVNAARHWDEVYGGRIHTRFFKTLADLGFHDCHWAQHGREVQTFWGHQAREPYQCDHFFVDSQTAAQGQVRDCVVVDNSRVRALSDHALLRLELTMDLGDHVSTPARAGEHRARHSRGVGTDRAADVIRGSWRRATCRPLTHLAVAGRVSAATLGRRQLVVRQGRGARIELCRCRCDCRFRSVFTWPESAVAVRVPGLPCLPGRR